MTGENFKRVNRHDDRLDEMRAQYYKMYEIAGEAWRKDFAGNPFEHYEKHAARARALARKIWEEAFYHYGRDWNAANEYCRRYSIFDD